MLLDFDHAGKLITAVPFQSEFQQWKSRMTAPDKAAIKLAIHQILDWVRFTPPHGFRVPTGAERRSTQSTRTDREDPVAAAKCFGLFVWECVLEREHEAWGSGRMKRTATP